MTAAEEQTFDESELEKTQRNPSKKFVNEVSSAWQIFGQISPGMKSIKSVPNAKCHV